MAYTFVACTVSINALCKQLIDASTLRFQHLLSLGNTLRYEFADVSSVTLHTMLHLIAILLFNLDLMAGIR